ncbi:hypothetical protein XOC_3620 [Xanthomonas oryzae pv. oryzicola BLS256]|uniref:Uncharacterized protein n=1 Tax=Xanthomonas oryzae pv. oryzicola (strain BLS256) TaxID=383407 RepID=G7TF03_XANOB|nr:hypothetical protein XOC_3620 [Xanthomonas oryzae pv. oryzicola BLS256]OWB27216.1 hypothetical protein XocBAI20_14145 [Xanthomonas oryzae pv. oryzicola]QEO96125.1 hypothetical protein XOCgx_1131 [Xanthomonas oryzae pv. oryzicola]
MKLLMTLLVGGVLGAAGYWWLERTAPQAKVEPPSSTMAIAVVEGRGVESLSRVARRSTLAVR